MRKMLKAIVALVAASTVALAPVAAHAVTPGVGDKTNAVRYGNDGPLGQIAPNLAFDDDTSETVESPFLLNFFGTTYTHICVSNNGGVFPTNDSAAECGDYDQDVASLAGEAEAPMVAVLASDTDTSKCDSTRAAPTFNDNETPSDDTDDFWEQNLIDDGWALPCSVYIGETTVDGKDAIVVTWYRVSQYENENNPALFNTYQLLLIKRATGDNTVGWDFDFEFNYATLMDDEDGYAVNDQGVYEDSECDAYDATWDFMDDSNDYDDVQLTSTKKTVDYPLCRWGIGVGNYTVDDGGTVGYEFFEQYSISQLIDSGNVAMIKHSLGSDVLGRYRCAMVNGEATGCDFSAELADTGADVNGFGIAGVALLAAGAVAVAARRRKA